PPPEPGRDLFLQHDGLVARAAFGLPFVSVRVPHFQPSSGQQCADRLRRRSLARGADELSDRRQTDLATRPYRRPQRAYPHDRAAGGAAGNRKRSGILRKHIGAHIGPASHYRRQYGNGMALFAGARTITSVNDPVTANYFSVLEPPSMGEGLALQRPNP